jgi:RNA polymerase sigma-70 factor (ECF subfamily)
MRPDGGAHAREATWLQRTSAGDKVAFEALYLAYHPRLYRFAIAQGVPMGMEDEIINDVMHVVWNRASTFDGSSRASTWIFGIAINKIRTARRMYARSVGRWTELESLDEHDADDSHGVAATHERERDLAQALARLGPEHRTALELTHYEGLSYREIAEVMSCPENTVKTRVFHARRKLAHLLGLTPVREST